MKGWQIFRPMINFILSQMKREITLSAENLLRNSYVYSITADSWTRHGLRVLTSPCIVKNLSVTLDSPKTFLVAYCGPENWPALQVTVNTYSVHYWYYMLYSYNNTWIFQCLKNISRLCSSSVSFFKLL